MKTFQRSLSNLDEIQSIELNFKPNLLLCFVSPQFEEIEGALSLLKNKFPEAIIAGCSTSGEILDVSVYDQSIALTAIEFEKTEIRLITENIEDPEHSHQAGLSIAKKLSGDKLKHIMIFSDGLHVNGAELVRGLRSGVSDKTSVTGGLAGDGSDFARTFVISDGNISEKKIIGIGFYSDDLKIGCGSKGGWDSFGLERRVTKARSNVLYEIDGQPALALYKTYLGDKAAELPSSGLLFPLSMRDQERELPVVRTILAVNEEDQSLTFAGDIPEGSYVRLMKANINRIIDGAQASAQLCNGKGAGSSLAILISCVGRRLVLKQLVEEEIEAVRGVLGEQPSITGFYSYGEIAPFEGFSPCQLHNQTMTITTFSE